MQEAAFERINPRVLDEELKHDGNTDWLCGCTWSFQCAHKLLRLIVTATLLPSPNTTADLSLGFLEWNAKNQQWQKESPGNYLKQVELCLRNAGRPEHAPRVSCCWLPRFTPYSSIFFRAPEAAGHPTIKFTLANFKTT